MKELVIISGKGGTGKTSLTAAFCHLAKQAVFADCDVDAADLHLILNPDIRRSETFVSGHEARIRPQDCTGCGTCRELCAFEAVAPATAPEGREIFHIDPFACEGCKVCVQFCPQQAIDFSPAECGQWYRSETRFGSMVHARLHIGAENSGKLVSLVREQARLVAQEQAANWLLVDGPPGIGCPVIASITGATAVLIVTEPTLSGQHDFERVAQLCRHFGIPAFLCVNKWDINPEQSETLSRCATENDVTVLGRIPYDPVFTTAQLQVQAVTEYAANETAKAIRQLWRQLQQQLASQPDQGKRPKGD
ncbi:MAG: ATP-binding protein [Desulfuromonadaceae bacterium]|nr:ATP-binding protein [Desulfuromonadaceae bacterium]